MEPIGQTTSNARGTAFELRMCMLLFVLGFIKKKKKFKIEYQVPAAQKFDDIVFHNDTDDVFVFQLKHNERGNKIIDHMDIFNNTSKQDKNLLKGNFILLKYVKSVIDMQRSSPFSGKIKMAFVLTNMQLDVNKHDQMILGGDPKKWYCDVNSIQLTKLNLPYDHVLTGSNSNQKAKRQADTLRQTIGNITDEEIKNALDLIVYAVEQPNDVKLEHIIKEEIKKEFQIEKKYKLDEEAEKFLKQELGIIINFDLNENLQALKLLAKTLQNFPLALQQAIAYIKKQRKRPKDNEDYSIQNYIREYLIKEEIINTNSTYKDGKTLLHFAASYKKLKIVEFLIKNKVEKNVRDKDGRTPLQVAIESKSFKIFNYLVEYGADVYIKDYNDTALLHSAVRSDGLKMVKLLIKNYKFDVNVKDSNQRTPLHDAISRTPLHDAISRSNLEIVKYLIDRGADVNAKDSNERTALHEVAKHSNLEIVKYFIDHGADVHAKDSNKRTALHEVAKHSNLEIVKYFIDHGADHCMNLLLAQILKLTALHESIISSNLEIVKYLIDHGAEVNAKDKDDNTVLHSCFEGMFLDEDIFILLIQQGANINLENNQGFTPLDIAKQELSPDKFRKFFKILERTLFRMSFN
uniref:CSON006168 protein n=1 Tax=Culicoides sonorensis TaxID=179676 RepID=A0A336N437_CULSO